MLNGIFGGEVRDKTGSTGNLKEVREEKEVRECAMRLKQNNNGRRENRKKSKSS